MQAAVDAYCSKESAPAQGASMNIAAFGGSIAIRWDADAQVTRWGGLSYFATFLKASKLLDRLVEDAPFEYTSPNAPKVRDVVGTMVLSILAGHTRYAHIDRLRNDTACTELLGMTKIVSADSVCRALKNCDQTKLEQWLARHERDVTESLLQYPYIIDIDNTIKPVYGHQEGAEIGYNPIKPGRPSYNHQTFFLGSVRLILGVDVLPGKQHSGVCGLPALWNLTDTLPGNCKPRLLRGDVGYGNETAMVAAEWRSIKYLFKIKRSRNVHALFKRMEFSGSWKDCGSGWEAIDTFIKLDGWTTVRRCLIVRRPAKKDATEQPVKRSRGRPKKNALVPVQQEFEFIEDTKGRQWDFFTLVTNDAELDPVALSQLYRDRGDCENNFDEFKNQWGWGGFVTKSMKPTRAMARLIGIVANWWNVFCRLANGEKHMEAITSRPMLLGVVGRIVKSGRKRTMHLTSTHCEARKIQRVLGAIGTFLTRISANAPQLEFNRTWALILKVAFRKWLMGKPLEPLSDGMQLLLPLTA